MITLYTFGPYFDLPDPSPFVMKGEVLLKMANLPFEIDTGGFNKAPKGKLPYISDGGEIVADSSLIRLHIEKKYGFDFDSGLFTTPERVLTQLEGELHQRKAVSVHTNRLSLKLRKLLFFFKGLYYHARLG